MIRQLFSFNGGVKPDSHKDESARVAIRPAPLPPVLTVPLRQNSRARGRATVKAGERVRKGQIIAVADGILGTATHAPTSGVVREITFAPMTHPSGLNTRCAIIEADGDDTPHEQAPFDWRTQPRAAALDFLRDNGLVGLGGATFPSHIKLGNGSGIDTLIINGAECEPWITCDDRLMQERADGVLAGARILFDLIGAKRVLVGIEDNKPAAIAAMQAAASRLDLPAEIVAVPTRYPAGGEKQLIRVLTGIEIPQGQLGGDFGVQCFNVGTAYAVHRAMEFGEPLISRIVTLTGNVATPGNFEVRIGTPVESLLPLAGPHADTDRYILGGPMMGFALPDLTAPIIKSSNCIIAASPRLLPAPPPELPCIRCGACARACPADLQPFELYWFSRARNFGKAQEYHLFDCIECGCCSYVCPSSIPLVDYYRFAKSEIWAKEREQNSADAARERFEFRNFRFEREKEEKAARLAAKAAETKSKLATGTTADGEDSKQALIAAALERAKAQKAEQGSAPKNTDPAALSAETRAEIAAIEARRAQADAASAADADSGRTPDAS